MHPDVSGQPIKGLHSKNLHHFPSFIERIPGALTLQGGSIAISLVAVPFSLRQYYKNLKMEICNSLETWF